MNQIIEMVSSPLGLIGIAVGAAWFFCVGSYPILRWVGLGVTLYAASLNKFFDEFAEEEWFPFFGPIEMLVQNGRPITIACLAALVLVSFLEKQGRFRLEPPGLMWPIHTIQVLLLVKMLTGSVSMGFIVQAAVVYVLVAALGICGVKDWLHGEKTLRGPAVALMTAVGLFCVLVEIQLRIDPIAAKVGNGRLIGTCGNPQHAAVLLAACLPGPLYFLTSGRATSMAVKVIAGVMLVPIAHLLFLTGSRTGAAMAMIILVIFFRRRIVLAGIAGGLVYATYAFLLDPGTQESSARLVSLEDTRSHVWQAQWESFLANPLFGAPVAGDRLGFGENSWLALMSTTGIVGAAVLLWLLVSILNECRSLFARERLAGRPLVNVDFCLAGFAALFAGSFLEAYLLGVITLPILAILTYSAASDRLLGSPKGKRLPKKAGRRRRGSQREILGIDRV